MSWQVLTLQSSLSGLPIRQFWQWRDATQNLQNMVPNMFQQVIRSCLSCGWAVLLSQLTDVHWQLGLKLMQLLIIILFTISPFLSWYSCVLQLTVWHFMHGIKYSELCLYMVHGKTYGYELHEWTNNVTSYCCSCTTDAAVTTCVMYVNAEVDRQYVLRSKANGKQSVKTVRHMHWQNYHSFHVICAALQAWPSWWTRPRLLICTMKQAWRHWAGSSGASISWYSIHTTRCASLFNQICCLARVAHGKNSAWQE